MHDGILRQEIVQLAADEDIGDNVSVETHQVGETHKDLKAVALTDCHQLNVLHDDLLHHVDARNADHLIWSNYHGKVCCTQALLKAQTPGPQITLQLVVIVAKQSTVSLT